MKTVTAMVFCILLIGLSAPCFGASFDTDSSRRSNPSSEAVWFECQATEVMEYDNRIHVKCANTQGLGRDQIHFIAVDKRDHEKANRFAAVATSAVIAAKIFRAKIPVGPGNNVPGCLPNDCRTPEVFGLVR